jgi:beta,beta-carotene 9',10'-dioxygenase
MDDQLFSMTARVRGSVPEWLRGELVRTCPAVFESGAWRAHHWFDALGMLYAFRVDGPLSVGFRRRMLETEVAREARSGRTPLASFGSPIVRSFLRRVVEPVPRITDNANVNCVRLGRELVALTESSRQVVVDPTTFETRSYVAYDDALPKKLAMSAHPHWDADRGVVVNVGTTFAPVPSIIVYEHAPLSRTRREIGRFSPARLPYVHSFGLTPRHAVLVAHPLTVRPLSLLWSNRPFIDHFTWRPEDGTRLVLVDRATGALREHHAPPCFTFHTVNTFEAGEDTVLDVLAYEDASVIGATRTEAMAQRLPDLRPQLVRLRMRAGRSEAEVTPIGGARFEFPTIAYRHRSGRDYGHCWGAANAASEDGKTWRSEIVHVDVASGAASAFAESGWVFGEPIHAARPGASGETDGVLLTVGTCEKEGRSALVVLSAETLEPLAWAEVDAPIPLGFHGTFHRGGASSAAATAE